MGAMFKANPHQQPLLVVSTRDGKKTNNRQPLFPVARKKISKFALVSAGCFIFVAVLMLYGGSSTSCACSAPTTTTTDTYANATVTTTAAGEVQPASPPLSFMSKCYTVQGAGPLLRGLLWISPPQAALAAALLLAGDRRHHTGRALAVATLAATAASNALFAKFALIVYMATAADLIGVFWAVVVGAYVAVSALIVVGLSAVLALVMLGGERGGE